MIEPLEIPRCLGLAAANELHGERSYLRILTFISRPRPTRVVTTLLPPYEKSGSVTPTTGKTVPDFPDRWAALVASRPG